MRRASIAKTEGSNFIFVAFNFEKSLCLIFLLVSDKTSIVHVEDVSECLFSDIRIPLLVYKPPMRAVCLFKHSALAGSIVPQAGGVARPLEGWLNAKPCRVRGAQCSARRRTRRD